MTSCLRVTVVVVALLVLTNIQTAAAGDDGKSNDFDSLTEKLNNLEGQVLEAREQAEKNDDAKSLDGEDGKMMDAEFEEQQGEQDEVDKIDTPPDGKSDDEKMDVELGKEQEELESLRNNEGRVISATSFRSCLLIKRRYSHLPSGEYLIRTVRGYVIKVFCEMGLGGGGYTFIHPASLYRISNSDLNAMFTLRTTFLMRLGTTTNKQPYAILSQLSQFRRIPLRLSLNSNVGYATPQNAARLSRKYLYYGFLPISTARNRNTQGLTVNSAQLTFRNCDANPNSYIALFPNFREQTPTRYAYGARFPFCVNMFARHLTNPSRRLMPYDYFMFLESHWGGCGCYTQTDGRPHYTQYFGAIIGFR